jgi:hypothetical protein
MSKLLMMENNNPIEQEIQALTPGFTWPSKAMPFQVPDGYFEALPDRLQANIDPVLPIGLSVNGQPFSVPDNYFEQLGNRILDKAQSDPPVNKGRLAFLFNKKIVLYAAAATIGGLLVAAAFLFTNSRPGSATLQQRITVVTEEPSTSSHTILVPENEVYREIAQKMQGVSDEEINNYLEETASTETIEWMPEEMN